MAAAGGHWHKFNAGPLAGVSIFVPKGADHETVSGSIAAKAWKQASSGPKLAHEVIGVGASEALIVTHGKSSNTGGGIPTAPDDATAIPVMVATKANMAAAGITKTGNGRYTNGKQTAAYSDTGLWIVSQGKYGSIQGIFSRRSHALHFLATGKNPLLAGLKQPPKKAVTHSNHGGYDNIMTIGHFTARINLNVGAWMVQGGKHLQYFRTQNEAETYLYALYAGVVK